MNLGKRSKTVLVIAGVLLAAETVTYCLFAERAMPLAGFRSLGDPGLVRGKRFALVPQETWDILTESQRSAFTGELRRHFTVIYHSEGEIPLANLSTRPITEKDIKNYEKWKRDGWVSPRTIEWQKRAIDRGYHITAYKDGVRLGWEPVWRVPFAMKCRASSWVSTQGAVSREDVYVWLFGRWVRVWNVYRVVA